MDSIDIGVSFSSNRLDISEILSDNLLISSISVTSPESFCSIWFFSSVSCAISFLINSKRTNAALKVKNTELNKQKDEINQQAVQLEEVNKELEKLSIVAGKTQNAIVIMDRNGYFEWVNAGFTRIYGYTLQLLRNERDENIVNVSENKSIRNILFKCVSNKQTIIFESDSVTRSGKTSREGYGNTTY